MSTGTVAPPASAAEEEARGTVGLLTDRLFGPYFFGKLLSTSGVWVFNIVAAIIVWDISRSTIAVGAVSIALFAPQLVLGPLSGAQADQRDPKAQLLAGRALITVAATGLAVALGILGVEGMPGAWAVILPAGIVGLGFVVGGPAQMSLLPDLVRPPELSAAVALNSLPPTIARAGGPVLGTFLLVAAGPAAAFAFTAVMNLAFALVIWRLPLDGRSQLAGKSDGTVRAGLAYVRTDPAVGALLVGMLAVGLGADPVVTLTPALSAAFDQGEALVGVFATAFGLGAAAGYFGIAPLRSRYGTDHVMRWGLVLLGGGMLVTGVIATVAGALTGLVIAGLGFCWAMTGTTTRIYERVPEQLRGRVMALWAIAFLGSRPLGAGLSGTLADATSVHLAFVGVAVVVGVLAAIAALGARRARGAVLMRPPPTHRWRRSHG